MCPGILTKIRDFGQPVQGSALSRLASMTVYFLLPSSVMLVEARTPLASSPIQYRKVLTLRFSAKPETVGSAFYFDYRHQGPQLNYVNSHCAL